MLHSALEVLHYWTMLKRRHLLCFGSNNYISLKNVASCVLVERFFFGEGGKWKNGEMRPEKPDVCESSSDSHLSSDRLQKPLWRSDNVFPVSVEQRWSCKYAGHWEGRNRRPGLCNFTKPEFELDDICCMDTRCLRPRWAFGWFPSVAWCNKNEVKCHDWQLSQGGTQHGQSLRRRL